MSTLRAAEWLDVEDVEPEDLVLQIVRQLVTDLKDQGMQLADRRFKEFFLGLRDRLRTEVELEGVDLGIDPLSFRFRLQDFPIARREFRRLLRGQLPRIYDLVNEGLLKEARAWLASPEGGGYSDVLLIVDELFEPPDLLDRVLEASGGHVRSVLVLMREMLGRVDDLPIGTRVVERTLRKAAIDMARPLSSSDRTILDQVHTTRQKVDVDDFFALLRNHFVLAYEDEDQAWYDRNPLLALVERKAAG